MGTDTLIPRILVCGGRDFTDRNRLIAALDAITLERGWVTPEELRDSHGNYMPEVHIIHGDARGADRMAEDWAVVNWCDFSRYPADWKKHGKAAGAIRNQQMLDEGKPDIVVAFPGGRGTADMIRRAIKAGVPVVEA